MTTFTTEDRVLSAQKPWPEPWVNAKHYRQDEIEFFWPLTEQIPLALDYTECESPKLTVSYPFDGTTGYSFHTWNTNATITASNLTLDVDTTTVKMKSEPHFIRKVLYNLLGLKWELK